jgi:hypothetical protein
MFSFGAGSGTNPALFLDQNTGEPILPPSTKR